MTCPKCHGAGRWTVQRDGERLMVPCDNPDCHAGQVSCCEGAASEPDTIVVSDVRVSRKHAAPFVIRARSPIVYRVSQDPCGIWLADGPPDVFLASVDRASLDANVHHMLGVMWMEYAIEDPEKLTTAAQRLRDEMLALFYDTHADAECPPEPECGPVVSEGGDAGVVGA